MAGPAQCATRQSITVGVPKEIKVRENRVGLTPCSAAEYIRQGHKVVVETNAGTGSGYCDDAYFRAGCEILPTAAEVFARSDMIVKVKEPLPSEYGFIKPGQVLYTYFHLSASRELTDAMLKTGAVCVAYETISKDGALPLLTPMSEVAGRMAVQEGAKHLEAPCGGRGILLGGVPGVRPGKVLVLGGGIVGYNAAKIAAGMGADVVIMDVNLNRLRHLDSVMPANVHTVFSTEENIANELKEADLVVGAVLVVGARAPRLVRREHLKTMKPGSVIVDVAVDQGGCCETCVPTTHDKPTFFVDGVLHYCVANMPGAVPYTSTAALNNATLPYGLALASLGLRGACKKFPELKGGLNVAYGKVLYEAVAETFGMELASVEEFLAS